MYGSPLRLRRQSHLPRFLARVREFSFLSVLACVHILLSKALAVSAINEEVSLKFCPKQLKRNARNSYAGQRYQLSLAPCLIQLRMLLRSQLDNCFLLCGMRNSGAARQSSNNIKLLLSGSRGITMR
jgi:hypothetical protein